VGARRSDQQEGQVIPALLLVVVCLVFLGFLYAQYGSAGDQAVQTQTAADSAAVADAHRLRDAALSQTVHQQLPAAFAFGAELVRGIPAVPATGLLAIACDAATANWSAPPHKSGLDCGAITVTSGAGTVEVRLVAPAGEVADGPAQVQGVAPRAGSTARVVVSRCPEGAMSAAGKAVADWIAQNMALAAPAPSCYTAEDELVLKKLLLLSPAGQVAAIGPAAPLLDAVSQGMTVEIIR
jgi:hypothetical protein